MNTLDKVKFHVEGKKYWEFVVPPISAEQLRQHYRNVQDANYFTLIDCPEHLTHKVKLYTFPHRYASVWECLVDGVTDSCPHFDTKLEEIEPNFIIDVCVLCDIGVAKEFEGFDCD